LKGVEGVLGSLVYTETEESGKGAGVAGVYLRVLEAETVLRIAGGYLRLEGVDGVFLGSWWVHTQVLG
jgi:hypothetical protein